MSQFEKTYPDGAGILVTTLDDQVVFAQTSNGTTGRGSAIVASADARELATALNAAADAADAFVATAVPSGAPLPGQPGGPAAGIADLVAQLGGTAGLEALLTALKDAEAAVAATPPLPPGPAPFPAPGVTFALYLTDGSRAEPTVNYDTQASAQTAANAYATAHPGATVNVKDSAGVQVYQVAPPVNPQA
jgi:hypothetical protein